MCRLALKRVEYYTRVQRVPLTTSDSVFSKWLSNFYILCPLFHTLLFFKESVGPGRPAIRSNKFPVIKESLPEIDVGFLECINCCLKYSFLTCWHITLSPVMLSDFIPYTSALRFHPTSEAENSPAQILHLGSRMPRISCCRI